VYRTTSVLILVACCVALLIPGLAVAAGGFDAFSVWQQGGFRGANIYPPQTTVDDLKVLRSWGANLAEIPVMDVFNPRPPYTLQPAEMEKLDRMVKAAVQADLFIVLTCRSGPG